MTTILIHKNHDRLLWGLVALVLTAILLIGLAGCGKGGSEQGGSKPVKYHCPMHPTVVSDQPGDCPICGMKLVPIKEATTEPQAAQTARNKKTMYRSTMNPNEVSDKPGKDSMGMEMVPFEVAEGGPASGVEGLAMVSITPETRQTMGLKLGTVEKRAMAREVRTSARIVVEETRLRQVTLKTEGWVDKLFVSYTGQAVKKGDRLFTIYSPDLVTAQQEYLTALEAKKNLAAGDLGGAQQSARALLAAARQRLKWWDISDEQINRLEKTRQVEKEITVSSPFDGVVIERNIVAGRKVMAGEVLMTIADLTEVWADADVYPSDLPYVKVGMPLEMTLPYWPGKTFEGKVIFISPTLDPQTRTVRARLEIPNPQGLLKPGMFADASLSYSIGEQLSIPAEAAMFSGKHTYAFKDGGEGRLIPTEIQTGVRSDGRYQLLSGLKEGDRIVVSANFLVDSESSMKAALEAMAGEQAGQQH